MSDMHAVLCKKQYNLEVYEHRSRHYCGRSSVCSSSVACGSGGHSLDSDCTQSFLFSTAPLSYACRLEVASAGTFPFFGQRCFRLGRRTGRESALSANTGPHSFAFLDLAPYRDSPSLSNSYEHANSDSDP